jgi:rhomboid protease GluP
MTTANDFQPAIGRWDTFALAATAPLGSFAHAHLAPSFPPALLNAALVSYLPLQDDELLLAIIDRGGPRAVGCCALTTRRVYWTESARQSQPPRRTGLPLPIQPRRQELVVRVADYAALPERITTTPAADGSSGIDLGGNTTIALGESGDALAAALARYLETMRNAARAGAFPEGLIDAELASRAAQALPAVARVSAQGRSFGKDLSDFRSSLQVATPRTPVTRALIAACVLVYVAMVARGVPWLFPSAQQLSDWGANHGTRVVVDHEYWRLLTNVFLHGGLIHLAVNMWSLLVVGPLVERLYGNVAFAVIYLASGIGGAIASLAASPIRVGVGASGAICGVLGALAAFLIVHRRVIPKSILKSFRGSLISVIVFMAALGVIVPNIDHQAHLGGVATGFLSGLLLTRPWPVLTRRWVTVRRVAATFLIAGALAASALGVVRRASTALPPEVWLQSFMEQIGPSLDDYNAVSRAAPSTLTLRKDFDDEQARAGHLASTQALIARALKNYATFSRLTTSDPQLRTKAKALVDAQSSQLAGLRGAERFLQTGDTESLNGSGGTLESMKHSKEAIHAFQEAQTRFFLEHKLIRDAAKP